MHTATPVSVVTETPAHIANRIETKDITSMNLNTGAVENHQIQSTIPVYGNVQEVKTIVRNDVKSYNLENRTMGPTVTTYST